jgi:ABC-type transporter Mla subunit MlaD
MAIEEDLSLNIEAALAAVDELANGLQTAIVAFFVAFDDAMQQISQAPVPVVVAPVLEGDPVEIVDEDQQVSISAEAGDASGAASQMEADISGISPEIVTQVEGEASGLKNEFEDALTPSEDIPEVVVPVSADASQALAETDDLRDKASEPVEVPVNIENSDAIADVAGGLQEASSAASELDSNVTGVGSSSQKTSEEVDKVAQSTKKAKDESEQLGTTWQEVANDAGKAAVAIAAAAAAAVGTLVASAIESQGASDAFFLSTGRFAEGILNVDVNGFSANLQQLAQDLGSNDEAVLGVAQKFALLGETSGATTEQVAQASSELFGVAAVLRATNPQLGTLEEIASRLPAAFAQGNRAARNLGLNLSNEAITTRAYQQTQKAANEELTQFDRVAAGASLAAEQFGDTMAEKIQQGLKNPIIELGRLRQVFGDAIEELGKPLIAPILDLVADFIPVALTFSEIMGRIGEAIVPIAKIAVESLAPVIDGLSDSTLGMLERLEPSFLTIGEGLVVFGGALAEIATIVSGAFLASIEGLAVGLAGIAEIFKFIGEGTTTVLIAMYAAVRAFQAVQTALTLGTLGIQPYVAALAALGFVVGSIISKLNATPPVWRELNQNILNSTATVDGLVFAIESYLKGVDEFLVTQKILENDALVENLNKANISVEEFARLIRDGADGTAELLEILFRDEEIRNFAENARFGYQAVTEGLDSLTEAQKRGLAESIGAGSATKSLLREQIALSDSLQETSKRAFEGILATEGLAGETARLVQQQFAARGEGENYNGMLEEQASRLEEAQAAEERRRIASGEAANEFREFATGYNNLLSEVALGITTSDNFSASLSRLGIEVEDAEATFETLNNAVSEFTSKVNAEIPSVVEAFSRLGEDDVTVGQLISDFEKSIDATVQWSDDLVRYAQENKGALLQVAAELGPERTRLLVDGYGKSEEELNAHLQRMQLAELNARVEAEIAAKIGFLQQRGLYEGQYEDLASILRDKAFFGPLTRQDLDTALVELQTFGPRISEETGIIGTDAANAYNENLTEGFRAGEQPGQIALREAIATAKAGGTEAAEQAGKETGVAIGIALETGLRESLGPVQGLLFSKILESGFFALASANSVGQKIGESLMDSWRLALLGRANFLVAETSAVIGEVGIVSGLAATEAGKNLAAALINGMLAEFIFVKDENILGEGIAEILISSVDSNKVLAFDFGKSLGSSLVQGMEEALRRGSSSVSRLAAGIIANAETAARDEAESESPSKAWERLGNDLVAGLSKGLDGAASAAARSASNVLSGATGAAGSVNNSSISVVVPVTINGNADPSMGSQIGRAAAAELRSVLRLEGRVA